MCYNMHTKNDLYRLEIEALWQLLEVPYKTFATAKEYIMKTCATCKITQPFYNYWKDISLKDGHRFDCKSCSGDKDLKKRRTKHGITVTIYNSQKNSSKKRGHQPPSYTQEEIREWLYSQDLFGVLYDNWVASGYKKSLKPSIDRISNHIGYTFENIQLMTSNENESKSGYDSARGDIHTGIKKRSVLQYSLDGELLNTFISVQLAGRETSTLATNISKACRGKYSTAGGFKWKYEKEQ